MAGRPKKGTSESNRTTSSNAWKPPPVEGTTSPQRALRWQAQGSKEEADEPVNSGSIYNSEDTRSEKGSTKSGSTARTSGTGKSSSKKDKKDKKRKEAAAKEAEGPPEPNEEDWYGDPLNPGIDQSLGPGGSLYAYTAGHKAKPRQGMCNPPMNPAIRAALVADLNKWKVEPLVTKNKGKQENADAEKQTRRKIVVLPPSGARNLGDDDATPETTGDVAALSAAAGGAFGVGSATSSRMSSPGPSTMRRSTSGSHMHRGGSPVDKKKKKKGDSAWQLDLTQEGTNKKHGLDSAPEGEIKWRSKQLLLKSRSHGFVIENTDVEHLGRLSSYHNSFSRGSLAHPMPPCHPVPPHRQLKESSIDLHSSHFVPGTSQSLNSISVDTMDTEFSPNRRMQRTYFDRGQPQEAPSMERLQEMANSAKHWGPHKLQSMCQNARISVHTAQKLRDDDRDEFGDTFDPLFDDGTFRSGPGATPRTSTGKALPVPHWGRNGSAPVLRHDGKMAMAS